MNRRISEFIFCAIDFETTGGNFSKDKIIEIGGVKIEDLNIKSIFHKIIDPLQKIPFRITKITGITNDMVQGYETIQEVKVPFLNFINNSIWIEHSQDWFDFNFFLNSFGFVGTIYRINTLELAKRLLKSKSYDLVSVANKLKITSVRSNGDKHNAADDSMITAKIFLAFCDALYKKGLTNFGDWKKESFVNEYRG